ncbi:fumarylacetoacetate hydrolase family protein [Vicingaceae bacterium]|nr:fumarylacetoacetate hydrolase family protein [Vicingaceae bacterium]
MLKKKLKELNLPNQTEEFAKLVDEAARSVSPIDQFASNAFDVEAAYEIQASSIAMRLERGERRTGIKMGFTSLAKMQQMGVHDLIWGRLTDQMMIAEGGEAASGRFIHPRVEPEIAFLLGDELAGSVTIPEAMSAVDAIAPAMEIIDSRYQDFKFSLADVVADNASSSGYVIGNWVFPNQSFDNLGIVMSINGRPKQVGSTAAILGNPVRSLVHAARLAAGADEPLQPGWIVLAGAATAAEPIKPGDRIHAEFQNLGHVSFGIN